MKNRFIILAEVSALTLLLGVRGTFAASPPDLGGEGVTLSGTQWETVLAQFESSVSSLSQWLEDARSEQKKNDEGIKGLETKVAALRKDNRENSNVINEIRLKGLLNDLKEKLEKNSQLQHDRDAKQKEFSQKAYSLISLYNDRIETVLGFTVAGTDPTKMDAQLRDLTALVQKRNRIQNLLEEYGKGGDPEKLLSISSLKSIRSHDRESLQLTLDLLRDRKKDLEEQMTKWALEQDEVKNELKLQGKMQEFLEDIRQINEDANFSRGGLRGNDLEGVAGKGLKGKMEIRLSELQAKTAQGSRTLSQIDQFIAKVQNQINSSNERDRK